MSTRSVDSSVLVFSLSSHRYSYNKSSLYLSLYWFIKIRTNLSSINRFIIEMPCCICSSRQPPPVSPEDLSLTVLFVKIPWFPVICILGYSCPRPRLVSLILISKPFISFHFIWSRGPYISFHCISRTFLMQWWIQTFLRPCLNYSLKRFTQILVPGDLNLSATSFRSSPKNTIFRRSPSSAQKQKPKS